MSTFATMLDEYLQKAEITQAILAERVGLTPAAISQYLSGSRDPELKSLLQICVALKVTPNDLLGFHSENRREINAENFRLREKINRAMEALE